MFLHTKVPMTLALSEKIHSVILKIVYDCQPGVESTGVIKLWPKINLVSLEVIAIADKENNLQPLTDYMRSYLLTLINYGELESLLWEDYIEVQKRNVLSKLEEAE